VAKIQNRRERGTGEVVILSEFLLKQNISNQGAACESLLILLCVMLSYFTAATSWDQVNRDALSEPQLEVLP